LFLFGSETERGAKLSDEQRAALGTENGACG
jgi:hypothetical protein